MNRRSFLIGAGGLALASCTKPDYPRASQAQVNQNFFYAGPPFSISLENMVNERNDVSEHTGVLINGSQRVLYDPAGDYYYRGRPRKDDIHYGMTDAWVKTYESFHARLGYYVLKQTKLVSREVADLAIQKAQEEGETYHMLCAMSASTVLQQLPGFQSIHKTISPDALMKEFGKLPDVQTEIIRENDVGQNIEAGAIENFDPNDTAPPPKPENGRGEG